MRKAKHGGKFKRDYKRVVCGLKGSELTRKFSGYDKKVPPHTHKKRRGHSFTVQAIFSSLRQILPSLLFLHQEDS